MLLTFNLLDNSVTELELSLLPGSSNCANSAYKNKCNCFFNRTQQYMLQSSYLEQVILIVNVIFRFIL